MERGGGVMIMAGEGKEEQSYAHLNKLTEVKHLPRLCSLHFLSLLSPLSSFPCPLPSAVL
jgi:hypothetical protein